MVTKRNLLRLLEREREQHAAERRLLIDQILHLSGKPWTPAPTSDNPVVVVEPVEQYTASPEQFV